MPHPLSQEEREYLLGMLTFERRAVIPLKWLILGVSIYFLIVLESPYRIPEVEPFVLFFLYGMFNIAQSYFFYLRPIALPQIRPFVFTSFLVDLLFVTGLLILDGRHFFGREMHSDLYVFYFLIVLRGVGVFRTASGKLLMNLALSALFILAVWQTFSQPQADPIRFREFALKLTLIWMVMLVSWFIINLMNRQAGQIVAVRERLMRSEHLASIGQLAAGVAHEINNPVGIITANCEFLLRSMPAKDERREDVEAIHKEALRVQGIVARLLDFSRPRDVTPVPCDLRRVNRETADFLFGGGKSGDMVLQTDEPEELPPILADPNQIKQALLNIYLNARQATDGRGRIDTTILPIQGGKVIEIAIADNGPGLSTDDLQHAFEPFYTRRKGGTGLGLHVTQRIVEAHGGTITLENAKPHGAVARLRFPSARTDGSERKGTEP